MCRRMCGRSDVRMPRSEGMGGCLRSWRSSCGANRLSPKHLVFLDSGVRYHPGLTCQQMNKHPAVVEVWLNFRCIFVHLCFDHNDSNFFKVLVVPHQLDSNFTRRALSATPKDALTPLSHRARPPSSFQKLVRPRER